MNEISGPYQTDPIELSSMLPSQHEEAENLWPGERHPPSHVGNSPDLRLPGFQNRREK